MRVSVVGLGKLGAPFAVALAEAGHEVIGVDSDSWPVTELDEGRSPVDEPGMTSGLLAADGRLRATTDLPAAVGATDVTFLVVPTPSDEDGSFSLTFLDTAIRAVGTSLRAKTDATHLVVVTSTVMPGATEGPLRAALEESAGRPLGPTLGLCYSPEFIALGSVLADLRDPDFVLVGESSSWEGDRLVEALEPMWRHEPQVRRMSYAAAELAKIAVNTFVTTKISFANMLSELSERLPSVDVDVVTDAIGLDTRIGTRYLRGRTPYGGPCFPRDNRALTALASSLGLRADIAEATDEVNRRQVDRLLTLLPTDVRSVAVIGMSYKAGTTVSEESTGVHLVRRLLDRGIDPMVADELIPPPRLAAMDTRLKVATLEEACQASVVYLTTEWLNHEELADAARRTPRGATIVDCWRQLAGVGGLAHARLVVPGAARRENLVPQELPNAR